MPPDNTSPAGDDLAIHLPETVTRLLDQLQAGVFAERQLTSAEIRAHAVELLGLLQGGRSHAS